MSFVTLDFETYYGTKYSLRNLTYEQYMMHKLFHVHGVGIKINRNPTEYIEDKYVKEALHDIFPTGNHHTMLCHNTAFDGTILSWWYGLRAEKYYCTQRISKALWNQSPSSLDALCKRLFPDDSSKWKGKELVKFFNIQRLTPIQQKTMSQYCIQDVDITFLAFEILWAMMPEEELEALDLTLQMFIHPGFVLDRNIVKEHLAVLKTQKTKAIAQSGTTKTILASNPKFVNYIRDTFGLEVPIIHAPTKKNPKNHKRTLAKDDLTCQKFITANPEIKDAFAGRFSVASTQEESRALRFLKHSQALPFKPDGVLAIPLNYAQAHTLRWGGANKINGQNLGRTSPLRRAIKAPEGFNIGVGDLSAIEGRMLAWWAEEPELIYLYNNHIDVYNVYGEKIYGRPIDRKRKIIIDNIETYPDFIEGHVGKTTVLGLGYQMGANKFKDTLEGGANGGPPIIIPFEQAYHIVHKVFRAENPNIIKAWNECESVIRDMLILNEDESYPWRHLIVERNRLRLPNGMYLNYPGLRHVKPENSNEYPYYEYWQGEYFTKIYPGKLTENIIQALARIIISVQMITINKWLKTEDTEQRVLLTVHDEIVALMRISGIEQRMKTMLEMMTVPPHWCHDDNLTLFAEGGFDVCYSK